MQRQTPPQTAELQHDPLVPGATAPRRVAVALGLTLAALALGHVVSMVLRYRLGKEYAFGLVPWLNLDNEAGIGTWASTSLLLACALVAALAARLAEARWRRNWWLLAGAFALLSLDEVVGMHEDLILPMRAAFGLSGVLYYGWVLPLVAAGALFLVAQLRFLVHLGRPTGLLLVVAGVVYVTGAAGLELVESLLAESGSKTGADYAAVAGVQEVLEIAGTMLALWALFDHLTARLRERAGSQGPESRASRTGVTGVSVGAS